MVVDSASVLGGGGRTGTEEVLPPPGQRDRRSPPVHRLHTLAYPKKNVHGTLLSPR